MFLVWLVAAAAWFFPSLFILQKGAITPDCISHKNFDNLTLTNSRFHPDT
jgi:hypothetical protein